MPVAKFLDHEWPIAEGEDVESVRDAISFFYPEVNNAQFNEVSNGDIVFTIAAGTKG